MNNTPFFEMLQANSSLALQSAEDAKCMALLSALGVTRHCNDEAGGNVLQHLRHCFHWIILPAPSLDPTEQRPNASEALALE
jgi:hypothetical protein